MGRETSKRYLLSILSLGLLVTAQFTIFPNHVSALSDYDSTVQPATNLVIKNRNNSDCGLDYTDTWPSLISQNLLQPELGSTGWVNFNNFWHNKLYWGVQKYFNGIQDIIQIWFSDSPDLTNYFSTDSTFGYIVEAKAPSNTGDYAVVNYRLDDACHIAVDGIAGKTSIGSTGILNAGRTAFSGTYMIHPLYSHVFNTVDPDGYEGDHIPDGSTFDVDGDGLTGAEEQGQGTSDNEIDTDDDGLSDLVESISYNPYYALMFCKQTSPFPCANPHPLEKDLFIEIDWMNDGTTAFKPTSTQLNLVKTMLENKGINVYLDLGEYGGGNALTGSKYSDTINWYETPGKLDIHDYKYGGDTTATGLSATLGPQFDYAYRQDVWRYMIYGVALIDDLETNRAVGGASETAKDDSIIASENNNYMDDYVYGTDRAIAGLLAHEIGHLLCLSSGQSFTEQDADCVYGAIDDSTESNYKSVMNYSYTLPVVSQLSSVDYSDGTNGTGDHDDWGAITGGGMGGFLYNDPIYTGYENAMTSMPKSIDKKNNKTKGYDGMPELKSKAEERQKKNFKVRELNSLVKRNHKRT